MGQRPDALGQPQDCPGGGQLPSAHRGSSHVKRPAGLLAAKCDIRGAANGCRNHPCFEGKLGHTLLIQLAKTCSSTERKALYKKQLVSKIYSESIWDLDAPPKIEPADGIRMLVTAWDKVSKVSPPRIAAPHPTNLCAGNDCPLLAPCRHHQAASCCTPRYTRTSCCSCSARIRHRRPATRHQRRARSSRACGRGTKPLHHFEYVLTCARTSKH